MSERIRITCGDVTVTATLDDTPSSRALLESLPFESSAETWGDEVYFRMPVSVAREDNARQVVDSGTVCIWVEGQSLCLPFGPTPISQGDECRLVAPVNLLGVMDDDPTVLKPVQAGDTVRVERA